MSEVITVPVSTNMYLFKTDLHSEIKPQMLDAISQTAFNKAAPGSIGPSKADWSVDSEVKRAYYDLMVRVFSETIEHLKEHLVVSRTTLTNYWAQQYDNTGSEHPWHTHPGCMYQMVYYAELPDSSVATEYLINNEVVRPLVSEGDVMVFPSIFPHRSPPNISSGRKTIIAMNFDIEIE